ncbi:hypothetical protein [Streptomyces sp. I05A-00742]|uniref:hypothetical protein n=1 Tax=Streptomyces sp. I05A-00742 TaxID=2732853 RepID=UPI001489D11E|nr:hypothetical protein [Streptomyces sp. I05A-00742]
MTGNDRNDPNDGTGRDVLDFPGAGRLRAAGKVAPPSADVVAAVLAAVRGAALAEEGRGAEGVAAVSGTRVPEACGAAPLRPRWRRRVPVIVSAAAVMAVAVGAAVWASPESGRGRVRPALAKPVEERAPFWEVQTVSMGREKGGSLKTYAKRTSWTARNESREREGDGPVYGTKMRKGASTGFGVQSWDIDWDELWNLPTGNPKALLQSLAGEKPDIGVPLPEELFDGIGGLLSESPAPPRVRAALYGLLPGITHVRPAGTVKDSRGRTGTALDFTGNDNRRSRLIIAPRTYQVLERAEFLVGRPNPDDPFLAGLKDGDVINRTTYLVSRPVWDAPPARPRTEQLVPVVPEGAPRAG